MEVELGEDDAGRVVEVCSFDESEEEEGESGLEDEDEGGAELELAAESDPNI